MTIPESEHLSGPATHELDPVAYRMSMSCPDCKDDRMFILPSDLWRKYSWDSVQCRVRGHGLARLRVAGPA